MELSEYVNAIKNHPDFRQAYVYHRYLPPTEAVYGPDLDLPDELFPIPQYLGIERFYKHQVDAIHRIRQGADVLVSTPTASGKSLIYNLAVLEAILRNEKTKALYIFPLKALEQDQLKGIQDLCFLIS